MKIIISVGPIAQIPTLSSLHPMSSSHFKMVWFLKVCLKVKLIKQLIKIKCTRCPLLTCPLFVINFNISISFQRLFFTGKEFKFTWELVTWARASNCSSVTSNISFCSLSLSAAILISVSQWVTRWSHYSCLWFNVNLSSSPKTPHLPPRTAAWAPGKWKVCDSCT